MPSHQCTRCQCTTPPPKRCAACKKAWYCSSKCQRRDWVCHIFDCKPTRAITNADYIAFAVEQNRVPEHHRAAADYGFGNEINYEHSEKLLKVYTDLLHPENGLGVKPTTLHRWKTEGTLAENMTREFQRLPEESRATHLSWFLQNLHVVDGQTVRECELQWIEPIEQAFRRVWGFIGLPETLPAADMIRYQDSLSIPRQECLLFYSFLLMGTVPDPSNPTWVKFGFAACGRSAESLLSKMFHLLIHHVTFDEFCAAYESASLVALMRNAYGLQMVEPYTVALLSETPEVSSVWWLIQFIKSVIIGGHESDLSFTPHNPIILIDYGFMNCKTVEDHRLLIDLYKAFFANKDSNPVALHQACTRGRLFRHFTDDLQYRLRQKNKYRRLLRNPRSMEAGP